MQADITSQLDLSRFPEAQRATIAASLSEMVVAELAKELYAELSPQEQLMFDNLPDETTEADAQQAWDFFSKRFPDIEIRSRRIAQQQQGKIITQLDQMIDLISQQKVSQNGS